MAASDCGVVASPMAVESLIGGMPPSVGGSGSAVISVTGGETMASGSAWPSPQSSTARSQAVEQASVVALFSGQSQDDVTWVKSRVKIDDQVSPKSSERITNSLSPSGQAHTRPSGS